ncbi:MAG: hypothetical protein GY835_09930, partial [bacterium]|nr:hypothetical protein [bacterium]
MDQGGASATITLSELPANDQAPHIAVANIVVATGDDQYSVSGLSDCSDDPTWALSSADGLQNVRLENRTQPPLGGPWPVTALPGIGCDPEAGYYRFDPVAVGGALGDEIFIVAEDDHPDWQASEALIWSALPVLPGAPQVDLGADDLIYSGGQYHLAINAGAITGEHDPATVAATVWRPDDTEWLRISDQSTQITFAQAATLALANGQEGDQVVVAVTDGGGRTTTVRVGVLEAATIPEVSFDAATYRVLEHGGSVEITLSLNSAPAGPAQVDFQIAAGSAIENQDYQLPAVRTLDFDPETTGASFTVTIIDDGDEESDETLTLSLGNASGITLGSQDITELTIIDNDGAPIEVFYSVGYSGNKLPSPIAMDISGGIAEFGEALPAGPDRGDQIVYDGGQVFIRSCSDDHHCEVFTGAGLVPANITGTTATGVWFAFGSLYDALEYAYDEEYLDTSDLVASNLVLNLVCYAGYEEGPVDIYGWTTGPDNYLRIVAPSAFGQRGASQRHQGAWSSGVYELYSYYDACIYSSIGNLRIEGLQIYCENEDDRAYGVLLSGAGVSGTVRISETIITLSPNPEDSYGQIAIAAEGVGDLTLELANNLLYDLGDLSADHVGIDVNDSSVTVLASNNTIIGGAFGIRQSQGTVIARNNLVTDASMACYSGTFAAESTNNLASDNSAPGLMPITDATVNFVDPGSADYHLGCGIDDQPVTISHDFPDSEPIFDGTSATMAVSQGINPAQVQLEFATPTEFTGTTVCLSNANFHSWMVAVADSVADMDEQGESYAEIVPWRTLASNERVWDSVELPEPVTAQVVRLTVERLSGDDYVHLCEFELTGLNLNPACGTAIDLSSEAGLAVALDVDSIARTGAWDIGADQSQGVYVGLAQDPQNVWEVGEPDGAAKVEVVLSAPVAEAVSVRYQTSDISATAGSDYQPVAGTLDFAPGITSATITIPVIADGEPEGYEELWVEIFAPGHALLGRSITSVFIQDDGPAPPRISFSSPEYVTSEDVGIFVATVELDRASSSAISVSWSARDGSARKGLDFPPTGTTMTFNPGEVSQEIYIPIIHDTLAEGDETMTLTLDWPVNAGIGVPGIALVTIIDQGHHDELAIFPEEFSLDMDGCVPVLQASEGAITGPSSITAVVTVLVDGEQWSSEPFPVSPGQPFDFELETSGYLELDLNADISLTIGAGEEFETAVVATVPYVAPTIDVEMIGVEFGDGMANVTIPAGAISNRLDEVTIAVYNYSSDEDEYDEPDDQCPNQTVANVPAAPGDSLFIEVCHGSDWECTEVELAESEPVELGVFPEEFFLDMDGCVPVLQASSDALTGPDSITVVVTVSEDGEEPWSFDPFPVNGGQPFDVELSDLPPFATISLTASVGEDS